GSEIAKDAVPGVGDLVLAEFEVALEVTQCLRESENGVTCGIRKANFATFAVFLLFFRRKGRHWFGILASGGIFLNRLRGLDRIAIVRKLEGVFRRLQVSVAEGVEDDLLGRRCVG